MFTISKKKEIIILDCVPIALVKPSSFEFDAFFKNMIQKKKDDHSYRVFRKVNRDANNFPMGEDFTFSHEPKPVTVWCSNDYLGMSRHKVVVQAAK